MKYWHIIRYGIPEEEAKRLELFAELAKELKTSEEAIPRASLFATEIEGVIQKGHTVVEIHAHANRTAEGILRRIMKVVFDRLHLEAVPLQALQDRPTASPASP